MGKHLSLATQKCFVMQRFEEVELLAVRAQLWRMEIEILREIHRYRFAKRGRRFGSDVELMIVYGAAILYYGFRTPVRALPISRYLEMPRETVRRHMGRLVALGLFERAEDQSFVPTKHTRRKAVERSSPTSVPTPSRLTSDLVNVQKIHDSDMEDGYMTENK